MEISKQGLKFIQNEEGIRLKAYQDTRGVWTIGVGHTGPDVYEGLVITADQAEDIFKKDLRRFMMAVNTAADAAPTTQGQYDAMVSLAFNIGVSAFRSQSSVARFHKRGMYAQAADAFLLWKRAGNDPDRLLPRRKRERNLYLTDVYS